MRTVGDVCGGGDDLMQKNTRPALLGRRGGCDQSDFCFGGGVNEWLDFGCILRCVTGGDSFAAASNPSTANEAIC